MKRLLAQIGITYFSVLVAAFYLPLEATAALGLTALTAGAILFAVKKARKTVFLPLVALAAAIACTVNLCYTAFAVKPLTDAYSGGVHTVKAVLTEEAYRSYSKYYYRLRITGIDGQEVGGKLLLKTPRPLDADPDDILTFTSQLQATENDYYRAKGFFLTADEYGVAVEVEPAVSHSLYYHAIRLRTMMRRVLNRYLPKDCVALCRAVLIGDKYALDTGVKDRFRYAGASYFVVVSGMHFAVVCMLLMKALKRLNRWIRLCIVILFMIVYAGVTGFQPSVVRAGVMMLFAVVGMTIRRQTYPLNHLGAAGLTAPLLLSPYCAGDVGMILSFYATMAILLWAQPIADRLCKKDEYGNILRLQIGSSAAERFKSVWNRIRRKESEMKKDGKTPFSWRLFLYQIYNCFAMVLSVGLAANILVIPISVFVFREFSLVTLLSGILLYFEIYLILILSLFVVAFAWLKPVALALSFPLTLLCRLVLWIVNGLGSVPFAYCRIGRNFIFVWMAASVALGIAVIACRNHYRYLKAAVYCSLVILLAGGLTDAVLQSQVLALEVYSCGNGLCAAVNDGGSLHILSMDAKSKELYPLWDELSRRFVKAQTALCTDKRELRHYQLYSEDEFAISSLLLYDECDRDYEGDHAIRFSDDAEFILDDELTLSVTVTKKTAVPYVTAADRHILLVPKGCSIDDIPAGKRKADIIVLSSYFDGAEELSCDRMVICGDRSSGLQTAKALKDCYNRVSLTDDGDITLWLR